MNAAEPMPTKFISVIHGGVYYKKKNSSLKTDKIIGTFPLGRSDTMTTFLDTTKTLLTDNSITFDDIVVSVLTKKLTPLQQKSSSLMVLDQSQTDLSLYIKYFFADEDDRTLKLCVLVETMRHEPPEPPAKKQKTLKTIDY